jgi:DNA-binding NarL/FixJ family response regulator
MTSVLIVSDHVIVRRGIREIIKEELRDAVVTEAATVHQGLAWLAKRSFELAILHMGMPRKGQFLDEVRRRRGDVPVLVVSRRAESQSASRALRQGASGYISQGASRAELVKALTSVLGGKQYTSEFLKAKPKAHVPAASAHHFLSAREHATMIALAAGKRQSEIAAELNLSIKTVSTYKRRVLNKLGIDSIAGLVRYVLENKIS